MKYMYFPGCSLKSSGKSYEESMLAVFKQLQIPVQEIDNWNCCGATNYMSINEQKAVAITARNLALAEMQSGNEETQLIAPCNACYMGLLKTQHYMETEPELNASITTALTSAGLDFHGKVKVRHPLDVLIKDYGLDKLKAAIKKPLKDLNVVSYYGCQIVRPIADFDDQRDPVCLDQIVMLLGATAIDWSMKVRCCGGSMTSTISDVGLRLNYYILKEAKKRKADVIITACPLCQFNLECFQKKISKKYGEDVEIPVIFFTQLIGMALGLSKNDLGLQRMFVQPQYA